MVVTTFRRISHFRQLYSAIPCAMFVRTLFPITRIRSKPPSSTPARIWLNAVIPCIPAVSTLDPVTSTSCVTIPGRDHIWIQSGCASPLLALVQLTPRIVTRCDPAMLIPSTIIRLNVTLEIMTSVDRPITMPRVPLNMVVPLIVTWLTRSRVIA